MIAIDKYINKFEIIVIALCTYPSTCHLVGENPFWMARNITGQVQNKEQEKCSKIMYNVIYALKMGVVCL